MILFMMTIKYLRNAGSSLIEMKHCQVALFAIFLVVLVVNAAYEGESCWPSNGALKKHVCGTCSDEARVLKFSKKVLC